MNVISLWLTLFLINFFLLGSGLTDIVLNQNGDREADYTLNDMDPETGFMIPVATYFGAKQTYEIKEGTKITWPGDKNEPPADVPRCGFDGNANECKEGGFRGVTVMSNQFSGLF